MECFGKVLKSFLPNTPSQVFDRALKKYRKTSQSGWFHAVYFPSQEMCFFHQQSFFIALFLPSSFASNNHVSGFVICNCQCRVDKERAEQRRIQNPIKNDDAFLQIKLTAKSCSLFSQKRLITDVPLETGHLMKSSESLTYVQFRYFLCPAGFDCHYYDNCCCYCYYYLIFCHWSLSVPPEKVKTPEDF